MPKVSFTNHSIKPFPFEKLLLKTFIPTIFIEEGVAFDRVDYIFCSDEYLLSLNQQYLNHDTYTDILTFTLSDEESPVISEIYISVDRVADNAIDHKVSFQDELHRVMIHGVLHLCGYDDTTESLKSEMTSKEDYYLQKING